MNSDRLDTPSRIESHFTTSMRIAIVVALGLVAVGWMDSILRHMAH